MKKLGWIAGGLILLEICLLFYANRARITARYEANYWKDRFEHSQWQLPMSSRTLGDNGLYAYEGYLFVHGADPTKYNAEIPPLGRYAIGAVIRLLGNDYWYGVIAAIITGLLYYLLAKKVFRDTAWALVATALCTLCPLFVSQWSATMLDMLYIGSFILFFLLLRNISGKKSSIVPVIATGVALGIFSGIKYPIFSVILLLTGSYYIWRETKRAGYIAVFFLSTLLTYLVSYAYYFSLGNTPLDWLRVQKWMVAFWTEGRLAANTGSIWTTLLFGRYQNLFTNQWQSVPEWNMTFPIITLLSVCLVYRWIKRKRQSRNLWGITLAASVILMMLFYTLTPFWTRYLLLIVPFLYLGALTLVRTIPDKRVMTAILVVLLAINTYTGIRTIFPTPESEVRQFISDWEQGFFQDMYERFSADAKNMTRYTFHRKMQSIVRDGEIVSITIDVVDPDWQRTKNYQFIPITITYGTRQLGAFFENVTLPVVKEDGQWRIPWKSGYFIPGLSDDSSLRTTILKRGILPGATIWITPNTVDPAQEQRMLKTLELLFGGLPNKASAIGF